MRKLVTVLKYTFVLIIILLFAMKKPNQTQVFHSVRFTDDALASQAEDKGDNPVNPDNLDITGSFEEEVNIPKMSAADVLNMTQVNDEEIEQPLEEEEEEYDPSTLEINPLKDSRVQESQAKDTTKIPESTARLYTKEEVEDLVKSQAGAFWANYLLQIKGVKTNQQVYRTAVRELIEFSKVLLQTLKEGRF